MKDSALFTGVTQEMGKRGVGGAPLHIFSCPPGLDLERQPLESKDPKGVSSYVSFPECAPTHTPCPQHFPNLPPGGESQSLCPSVPGHFKTTPLKYLALGVTPISGATLHNLQSCKCPPPQPLSLQAQHPQGPATRDLHAPVHTE